MKKSSKIILILSLIFSLLAAQAAYGASIPKPTADFYVADYAHVLSPKTEDYIVSQNDELSRFCGGQIVVVTVDFLDGADIEDYAYKLFNEWKIGDEDLDNGVLLLLAIGEENYWCMQGKGLEGELTSGDIDDILWDNLEPPFADGDYESGVLDTFDELYERVHYIYDYTDASSSSLSDFEFSEISFRDKITILIVIIIVLIFLARLKNRGYRGSGYGRSRRRNSGSGRSVRRSSSSRRRSSSSRRSGGGGRSRGGGAGRRK